MKCIACGREMLSEGAYFVCSNLLCDYAEEIAYRDVRESGHYSLAYVQQLYGL